jgi:cell division protein FtsB
MNLFMQAFATFLPWLSIVLALCVTVGGIFAIRNGQQVQLVKFQKDTNDALRDRIEALEGKISDFEKENVIQRHVIDTIVSALKQRGMMVTIDGDMVSIVDNAGTSQHRKRMTATTTTVARAIRNEESI